WLQRGASGMILRVNSPGLMGSGITMDSQECQKPGPLTQLLRQAADGDEGSSQKVFATVYEDLRSLARQRLCGRRAGHTLQATALVNEAYLRLVGRGGELNFATRAQFFHAAAQAMRRILVDHARTRCRQKRGGSIRSVPLDQLGGVADLAAADSDP